MTFRDIKLGYASAEEESATQPELLLTGYFDLDNIVQEAREGSKFLFLGYKDSGKSAISEHLRLTSERDSQFFVTNTFLSDFPFRGFQGNNQARRRTGVKIGRKDYSFETDGCHRYIEVKTTRYGMTAAGFKLSTNDRKVVVTAQLLSSLGADEVRNVPTSVVASTPEDNGSRRSKIEKTC